MQPLRRWLLLGGTVALGLSLAVIPWVVDMASLEKRLTEAEPLYNRIALGATAIDGILHHPVAGLGSGRYRFLTCKKDHLTSAFGVPTMWAMAGVGVPHSELLHLLFLVGLLGFIPWIMAWRHGLHPAWSSRDDGDGTHDPATVALAMAATFLFTALTLDTGLLYFASLQMWVVLGVLAGARSAARSVSVR